MCYTNTGYWLLRNIKCFCASFPTVASLDDLMRYNYRASDRWKTCSHGRSLWPVVTPLACSQIITNFVGGRGGAIIIVLWNAPIIPINGPSVMRLMVGDLICITLS